jgi:hypothetical protein
MTITRQCKCDNRWMDVIRDAESEISVMKTRISQLKIAIRAFKQKFENGEPLPAGLKAIKEP